MLDRGPSINSWRNREIGKTWLVRLVSYFYISYMDGVMPSFLFLCTFFFFIKVVFFFHHKGAWWWAPHLTWTPRVPVITKYPVNPEMIKISGSGYYKKIAWNKKKTIIVFHAFLDRKEARYDQKYRTKVECILEYTMCWVSHTSYQSRNSE